MTALAQGVRSAATLGVLCGLLVVASIWGWSALTAPLPEEVSSDDPCVVTNVAAGTKIYPDQVLVSVLNAGSRAGLAGRTMQLLVDEGGFVEGQSGNAPKGTKVQKAEVWALNTNDAAARLVASWLGPDVKVVAKQGDALGIVVVVGDEFEELAQGRKSVAAKEAMSLCTPPDSGL